MGDPFEPCKATGISLFPHLLAIWNFLNSVAILLLLLGKERIYFGILGGQRMGRAWCGGSQSGVITPSKKHLAMHRNIWGCHSWGGRVVLLASSG